MTCDGQHYDCPACFKIKLRTVQFEGIGAQSRRDKDDTLSRDLAAYKTLRRQGVQPQHVFGSAEIAAQAETKFEAEHHKILTPELRRKFKAEMDAVTA